MEEATDLFQPSPGVPSTVEHVDFVTHENILLQLFKTVNKGVTKIF